MSIRLGRFNVLLSSDADNRCSSGVEIPIDYLYGIDLLALFLGSSGSSNPRL